MHFPRSFGDWHLGVYWLKNNCLVGRGLSTVAIVHLRSLHLVLLAYCPAAPRSLIFCNKIEACRDVENFLRRNFEGENLKVSDVRWNLF